MSAAWRAGLRRWTLEPRPGDLAIHGDAGTLLASRVLPGIEIETTFDATWLTVVPRGVAAPLGQPASS